MTKCERLEPQSYCVAVGIDVSFFSEEVRERMEEDMKKNITDRVLAVHPYKLPTEEDYAKKGRCKTHVKDEGSKEKRTTIYATSSDEMIQKLYDHYFGKAKKKSRSSFEEVFRRVIDHHREFSTIKEQTIVDHEREFKRFFADDPFVKKSLSDISIADVASFLDRAHIKVSEKNRQRGQKVIEKHRHNSIRTIINMVYGFANTYESANLINPILSLDYGRFPYYDGEKVGEHPWFDESDRDKLAIAFDSIKNPDAGDLCVGFIIETAARNSEARAIRFGDFHFDAEVPHVRICGFARDGHRDEEIKADSYAGKRNQPMTERLVRIFEKAKEVSWSDEFLFVREPCYVKGNEVLISMSNVERKMKRLCKSAGVQYLPPHQVRHSEATIMAKQEKGAQAIQRRLGHTGPEMGQKYQRDFALSVVATGADLSQSIPIKNAPKH